MRDADTPGSGRDLPAPGPFARLHLFAGRLAGLGVHFTRPPISFGVRLLAFDASGRVFLVRHSYVPGWHLPGGGVDRGETARAAAIREAEEEGRLSLPTPPDLFHIYLRRSAGIDDHVVLFIARGVTMRDGWRPSAEIREAAFHGAEALPPETTPATRARIAEARGTTAKSDFW